MQTTKLNPNAQKWVEALKSGKYKQCKGALTRIKDRKTSHCCLGVACELYRKEHALITKTLREPSPSRKEYDGEVEALPSAVQDWLGLRDNVGYISDSKSLAEMNDDGSSFKTIAKIIESMPEGLFE